MNKIIKKVSIGILYISLAFSQFSTINNNIIVSEAHSGRTDSSGGHHDNKNKSGLGSYHYHCGGNPAHLHEGGVCPYSNYNYSTISDDLTTSSSSTSKSIPPNKIELSNGDEINTSKDLIKIVQDVLNQKGYECGKVDGIAGTKTKEAIKKFIENNKNNDDTDFLIISMIAESLDIN